MKCINRKNFLPKIEVFFPKIKEDQKKRSSPKIEVLFFPKSGEDQKIYALKGCVSGHALSVQNATKEDIWAFFNVLGGQIIFHQKGGHILEKEDVW